MELLNFLTVLLAVVTLGLGQSTQRVSCNLDDQVTCLRAELSAVKVMNEELLLKNRELESENNDLQEKMQSCSQECLQNCSRPSGSEQWIDGGRKSKECYNVVVSRIQFFNNRSDLYVFNSHVTKMSIIEGQLWVPVINHTIQILDPNMSSKIKEISLTNIHANMRPNSVHQTNSNHVLLAASQGLYVLDIHGSYLYQVESGHITDIAIVCNNAYVYNQTNNNIVTVSYISGQWNVTNTFTASRSNRGPNTLTFSDTLLYVGSSVSNTIQSYTTSGIYINNYSVNDNSLLRYINLCGSYSQWSLLVSDQYNNRLKVMKPGGIWNEYKLQGVIYPYDVLVDTTGNLWISWHDKGDKYRISKFSVLRW